MQKKKLLLTCLISMLCSTLHAEPFTLPDGHLPNLNRPDWRATPAEVNVEQAVLANNTRKRSENLLGRGYNGLSGELRGTCLTGDRVPSGTEGKKVDYSLHIAGSSEEYRRSINMSAGASFGLGIWSTDAAVSYFQSSARSRYVDHLVIRVVVLGPTLTFESPKLTLEAQKRVRNKIDFYRVCGNRYVSSLSFGGEFTAVADIETSSDAERSALRSTLSVIAKGYGSANAAYAEAIEKVSTYHQKNIRIVRNGTGEVIPNPEIQNIIKYSLEFPAKINTDTGIPVALVHSDYRTVEPSIEVFSAQEILVERMAQKFGDLFETLGDLDYYARHRTAGSFYPPLSDQELDRSRDLLGNAALTAKLAFNSCVEDPVSRCTLSSFPDARVDAPRPAQINSLNPKIGSSQSVGAAGKGEEKTVLIVGDWSAWDNGEHLWWPPERCCFTVEIAEEGKPPTAMPYQGPIKFSGPARASVRIGDSTYEDNRGRGLVAIVY